VSEIKTFLAIFHTQPLLKELKTEKLQQLYEVISSKGMYLFDMKEFQQRFPLLFSNPDLFYLVCKFTEADVQADPIYDQRFGPENIVLGRFVLEKTPRQH
jgi:hypothetical protein